jgi:hypothetical protein
LLPLGLAILVVAVAAGFILVLKWRPVKLKPKP